MDYRNYIVTDHALQCSTSNHGNLIILKSFFTMMLYYRCTGTCAIDVSGNKRKSWNWISRAGIVIQVCWLIHHLLMTVSYCLKLLVEYLNKYTTSCLLWFSVLISTSYIWKIYHKYYKPIFYLHLQAQPLQKKVYIFTKIPWQRCITLYMYCNTQITYCTLVKTSIFFSIS